MTSLPSFLVAIKIRPYLRTKGDDANSWRIKDNSIQLIDSQSDPFYFDFIFDANTRNEFIFEKMAKHIVHSSIQGFNGTIFAYGQTSSGKTYTMMGDEQNPGVIVLAAKEIFKVVANSADRKFLLRVGYFEIYNEKIYDLLNKDNKDLKIHEPNYVNCEEKVILCEQDLLNFLCLGNKNRTVGETQMNNRSSRSHAIFRIIIESRKKDRSEDDAFIRSVLNLVDLAGSERADQTGARGRRLKEGGHINKSLLFLSNVIKQLSENEDYKYISYRDSKLTRILQASLGGNALTSIICTIKTAAIEETQSTLNFALRAKNIKNKPQVNEVLTDAQMLKRLNKELSNYKTLLDKERKKNLSQFCLGKIEKRISDESHQIVNFYTLNSCNTKDKRRRTWCLSNNKDEENGTVELSNLPSDSLKKQKYAFLTPHIGARNSNMNSIGSTLVEKEENDEKHNLIKNLAGSKDNKSPEKNDFLEYTFTRPAVQGINAIEKDFLELKEFIDREKDIEFDYEMFNGLKGELDNSANLRIPTEHESFSYTQNFGETIKAPLRKAKCDMICLSYESSHEQKLFEDNVDNKKMLSHLGTECVTPVIESTNKTDVSNNSLFAQMLKTTEENRLLKFQISTLKLVTNTILEKNSVIFKNLLHKYDTLKKINFELLTEINDFKNFFGFSIPIKSFIQQLKYIYEIEFNMGNQEARVFRLLENADLKLPLVKIIIENNDQSVNKNVKPMMFKVLGINSNELDHNRDKRNDDLETIKKMQREIDRLKQANEFLLTENEITITELRKQIENLSLELSKKSLFMEKHSSDKKESQTFNRELIEVDLVNENMKTMLFFFEPEIKNNECQSGEKSICEKELRQSEECIPNYKTRINELQNEIQKVNKCKEILQQKLEELRLQYSNHIQENKNKLSAYQANICDLQEANRKFVLKDKTYEKEVNKLKSNIEELSNALTNTKNQFLLLEQKNTEFENENIILNQTRSALENELLTIKSKNDHSSVGETIDLIEKFLKNMYECVFVKENIHSKIMIPLQSIIEESCQEHDKSISYTKEKFHLDYDNKCSETLEFIKNKFSYKNEELNLSIHRIYENLRDLYTISNLWRKFVFEILPLGESLKEAKKYKETMSMQIKKFAFQLQTAKHIVMNFCKTYEKMKDNERKKYIRLLKIKSLVSDVCNTKQNPNKDLNGSDHCINFQCVSKEILGYKQRFLDIDSEKFNTYDYKKEHNKYKIMQERNSHKELLERKNRRLNVYNERRHVYNLQVLISDVSTMTDFQVEECHTCVELEHKLKECKRNLFIEESRVTALQLDIKNHPLKMEILALEKRLKDEQEKNKSELSLFCEHKSQKSNIVPNNLKNSATQTELDVTESLKKLQGKYEDLKQICRARYNVIKDLKEKIENKEKTCNNKEQYQE